MCRHMLGFLKLRNGLIRESITSTFLLQKEKCNLYVSVCLCSSYEGMLAKRHQNLKAQQ